MHLSKYKPSHVHSVNSADLTHSQNNLTFNK